MTGSASTGRVDILGVEVSTVDMADALSEISGWIDRGDRRYVCVTGVHGVMESQTDSDLRAIHNASGLTVPDGMPLVWMGRMAGAPDMERVCGPDLTLELCELAAERGWKSYFYGGADGVPEKLAEQLRARYPGLKVVGAYSPPFRPLEAGEIEEVADRINRAQPDIVWVGLSTPKQELWMAEFRDRLDAAVLIGVGAVFDLYAGGARRAPGWMQRSGTEWIYRLFKEPKRLWRRYLTNNPRFVLSVLRSPPRLVNAHGRRGSFVVVVGPDGSGKTTVARQLLTRNQGRYFHFRPPFSARSMPRLPPVQEAPPTKEPPPSPAPIGWLRIARNFMSSWIGYLASVRPSLRRGELVIGDRWMYGYLVQPRPLRFSGPRWLASLLISWLPRPDLVVNLRAPVTVIRQRKQELAESAITGELEAWAALPVDNLITIDSEGAPDVIAAQVEARLSDKSDDESWRQDNPALG